MDKDTLTILIIAGLTLFVWVPAIVLSIIRAMRKEKVGPMKETHKQFYIAPASEMVELKPRGILCVSNFQNSPENRELLDGSWGSF